MKLRKSLFILSFASGLFAFTSCQDNNRQNETEDVDLENYETGVTDESETAEERVNWENSDVTTRIQDEEELSTFSQGMSRAELSDDFREEEGPFTIFAPSNVAYDELSQEERNQFQNVQNRDRNAASMHYLVVQEELTGDELREEIRNANGNYTLTTMQGEQITATMGQGDNIVLRDGSGNSATITETDLDASNGTVHVIDRVLKPQDDSRNEAANRNNNMNNNNTRSTNTNNTGNNNTGNNNTGNTNTTTGNNNTGNNNTGNTNRNNTGNNQ